MIEIIISIEILFIYSFFFSILDYFVDLINSVSTCIIRNNWFDLVIKIHIRYERNRILFFFFFYWIFSLLRIHTKSKWYFTKMFSTIIPRIRKQKNIERQKISTRIANQYDSFNKTIDAGGRFQTLEIEKKRERVFSKICGFLKQNLKKKPICLIEWI